MKAEILPAPASSVEREWVEGELVRSLMRTQRTTQWVGLLLVSVVLGVLPDDAPPMVIVGWLGLWGCVAAWRWWMMRHYEREILPLPTREHLEFFRRHRQVWPVSALVWGLTGVLYFDRAPLGDQYICWLTLA